MTKSAPRLTIGKLATFVGVTPRAIRFYHSKGLLREPSRDASGYRLYDATAVVDLVRIKTLVEAGVPLARVAQLVRADQDEFEAAVTSIDRELVERSTRLDEQRRRLADLVHGDRLYLSDQVVGLLDDLRGMGISARGVDTERDGWIMISALSPELVTALAAQKREALADREFRRLYVDCDAAFDWDPDDPRLLELAGRIHDWTARHPESDYAGAAVEEGVAMAIQLLSADVEAASPAWRRLAGLMTT